MPDHPVDVRLVALDMDGTLLDGNGEVPAGFWPLVERMQRDGIVVVPASGRQYATLVDQFDDASREMGFIAENGTLVAHRGRVLSTSALEPQIVREVVATVRQVARDRDIGVVVCGAESAYVERVDAPFRGEADRYYASLREVDDLLDVDDTIIKLAIFDFGDAEHGTAPHVLPFRATHEVVVAGPHWIDVMNRGVHKGAGLRRLQEELTITPAQTVVFGDYLNDLEMLDAADHSFAMSNAHPDVLARARYVAPSNVEGGVVTVLEHLLG